MYNAHVVFASKSESTQKVFELAPFIQDMAASEWIAEAKSVHITDEEGVVWLDYTRPYKVFMIVYRWLLVEGERPEDARNMPGFSYDNVPMALRATLRLMHGVETSALAVTLRAEGKEFFYMRMK